MVKAFRRNLGKKEGESTESVQTVAPVNQALALATRLPRHFIVRLNDGNSTEFFKRIEGIESVIEGDEHPLDVPKICDEIDQCVQQFAQAQTRQIDETLDTFTKAVEELVDGLDKTVVDQGVRLIEIQKIKTGLGKVDETSTLEEIKDILSAGIAEVSKLVDRELEIQRELRKVHERYKGRFLEDLGRTESEVRIDPVTKIANRAGIDRHFRAACDHVRTNGSNYTFAVVNLEGCSGLRERIGDAAADNALAAFAQRLQAAVGGAFIGRLGNDDFVVIASGDLTPLSRLLTTLVERLAVHPIGGIKKDPVVPCFGVCKIEPAGVMEELVSDCESSIDRQRPLTKAA